MAKISTYDTDLVVSRDDILIGSDKDNSDVTRNYTVGSLIDFIAFDVVNISDTNYYLDGVTANSATGVVTFSVNGSTNPTLTLGTAAFSATTDFAAASHSHTLGDIVGANSIGANELNISGNGTAGQILISDGDGSFSWATDATIPDTNYYLDGITINGNDLVFSVNGAASQTVTLGSAAFSSTTDIINQVKTNVTLKDLDSSSLGDLSALDLVTTNYIDSDAVTTAKIKDANITEAKLKVSNSPVSGYVLTSDGSDGFSWVLNSASNYYLDGITRSNETLTFSINGGTDVTYTFGEAAFLDVGNLASQVAAGNHTHSMSAISDAGALATLDTVSSNEIDNQSITTAKLSATGGTNGQVLALNSSLELEWIAGQSGASDFIALSDTPASMGTAGQMLKVNSGATALEFSDFKISNTNHFTTTTTGSSGLVLAVDANNDGSTGYKALKWISAGSVGATTFTGLSDTPSALGSAHQILTVNAAGTDLEYRALDADHISTGLITSTMISDGTITGTDIASATITNGNIQSSTITNAELANNCITANNITDGVVGNVKLATNAITTVKIADANVTLAKLATDITLDALPNAEDTRTEWDTVNNTKIDWYVNAVNKMRLEADGDLLLTGDVTGYATLTASDKTLKTNITTIEDPIDKVKQLDGVTFNWLKNGKASAGVIAQDVQKVLPEIVSEVKSLDDTSSHLAVDYNGIIGLLIETVKEQQNQIDELKALVKA